MSNPCTSFTSNCRARLFFYLLIFMLANSGRFVPGAQAQNQNPCENVVAEAQKLYDDGHFAPAISLLRPCLPDRVPEEHRLGAYRQLALAYLAEDKPEEAKGAINNIFGVKRDYACDPSQDSQPYCNLVEEVKTALPMTTSEKLFSGPKKWFWIGGGVALAAYLIAKNAGPPPEEPLDGPPPLP